MYSTILQLIIIKLIETLAKALVRLSRKTLTSLLLSHRLFEL